MLKEMIVSVTPVSMINYLEILLLKHYKMSKFLLSKSNPNILEKISEKKALAVFNKAANKIPAYKKFLSDHDIKSNNIKNIQQFNNLVPETTKNNYVKKNKFEDLCYFGELPRKGIIEESSGSSGKPTNWIKGFSESELLDLEVGFESEYLLEMKKKNYIVISCWSFGPWTTDLKFCEFFEHYGLVKNVGPNVQGVLDLIKKFGNRYNYLIAGYPPFCKFLFESTKAFVNWKDYNVDLLVGGEGFIVV